MADITVKINPYAVRSAIHQTIAPEAVARAAGRLRDRAKMEVYTAGRIDTGALWQSIEARRVSSSKDGTVWYEVGSRLRYALWQHNGVKGPIYPRRAKVLRFKPKGASGYVFAQRVAGFRGVPYLKRPLRQMRADDYA